MPSVAPQAKNAFDEVLQIQDMYARMFGLLNMYCECRSARTRAFGDAHAACRQRKLRFEYASLAVSNAQSILVANKNMFSNADWESLKTFMSEFLGDCGFDGHVHILNATARLPERCAQFVPIVRARDSICSFCEAAPALVATQLSGMRPCKQFVLVVAALL